jgi:hypothetical protein
MTTMNQYHLAIPRTAVIHRILSQPLSYRLIQDTSSQALNCHQIFLALELQAYPRYIFSGFELPP